MTEKPILFSGEMVRAILEDRKNQTRRVVKPQPSAGVRFSPFFPSGLEDGHGRELKCPWKPGDCRLWVRESFMAESRETIHYRADGWGYSDCPNSGWTPSIFMPRWASRITLEVTEVRAQRLQDISHEDAMAEGCSGYDWVASSPYIYGPHTDSGELPDEEFKRLWDSINGKRPGCAWNDNPWVWAISFKRVQA